MKPRLSRKARVRPDPRDGQPVLLSPERGLRLNPSAAAILALCDGTRELDAIVDALSARHGAPRERVAADVLALLRDLHGRALVEDFEPPDLPSPKPILAPERARSHDPESPYTLVAELTHRCPLACPYCSNPRELIGASAELSTDEWLRVLDEAADLGVMQVHLSGGEPLARRDLEPIAAHARTKDLYVNLVTSGLPLSVERLERLAPSLDHVQLSVQDATASSSDRIAGLPAWDAKMRVAGWIKALGLPLTLNVVLHRANLDHLDAILSMAERLGADRLELANVQMVTWALANADALLPTRAQIEGARAVARSARERLAGRMEIVLVLPDWHADRPRPCMDGWGRRFLVVAPDGSVLPCHAARTLPLVFEGVRSGSLRDIWQKGAGMSAFRGTQWMPEPCRSCDQREVDHGGCRCQAFALTGNASATDPACSLAPSHGLVVEARARAEKEGRSQPVWIYRGR